MQTAKPSSTSRPAIHLTEDDYDKLSALVGALSSPSPGAALLAQELDRAAIVGARYRGQPFVKLDSIVDYEDLATGQVRRLRVVLPKDARIEDNTVSILSPAGAALIGLKVGQSMHWEVADGRTQTLKVLAVSDGAGGVSDHG